MRPYVLLSLRLAGLAGILACTVFLTALPVHAQQRATLRGSVTDSQDGQPLIGVNVILAGTEFGAATDIDGTYQIVGLAPGTYDVAFRYVGYEEVTTPVTLSAGETRTLDMQLEQGGVELNTVVVTASRQAEKVLDAPASISVLSAREIATEASTSSVNVLRNVTGVDMSQTGIDRREVVLRGFNNAFGGSAYALVDYRQAAAPALAVNMWSVMPITAIDVERVEVVRGPGSALYGAGVDAGVVHFITKDPFTSPGTTVALQGGTRSTFGGQFRHAGVVGGSFGYKVVGEYLQANEWELDPSDPADLEQLENDLVPRNYDYQKYKVNGELQYRFTDQTSLAFNVGTAGLTGPTLSGIGNLQADGFGYTFGQLRLQAGAFFAQAYLNLNDAGDSFVYGQDLDGDGIPDPVTDKGQLFSAQTQYDFSFWSDRQQLILGADYESIIPRTEGTINGRNEDDDTITEYGLYAQSTTALTPQFDLTLALRGDYNDIVEEFRLSPRAAVVYKPTTSNTFRATFNRAFSSPGSNSNFLDIIARSPDGTLPFAVRGRGSAQGFTFERNPAFAAFAGSDLVASSVIGCVGANGLPLANPAPTCGAPTPTGLDLGSTYGLVYQGLSQIPTAALGAQLEVALGLPEGALPDAQVAGLVALLAPTLTTVEGFSQGLLVKLNPSTGGTEPISDVVDVQPLQQTTSSTFEVGYKGIIANRLLLAVDGYYVQKENFVGPLLMETPFVIVPTLSQNLTTSLTAGITGNDALATALQGLGVSPAEAAALIVGLASGSLPSNTTPVAIVQAQENNPGVGEVPELMLAYRNFGNVTYYGMDITTQFLVNEQLSVFANGSWVSDDFFDNTELDEENDALALALNAPAMKVKGGFTYDSPSGWSVNAAARYVDSFPVRSGPYVGMVEDYFLIDLGGGYEFRSVAPGLRLDVTLENILNNEHREFVGAPEMGFIGMAKLTYDF